MSSSVTPFSTRDAEFGELNIDTAASLLAVSGDIALVIDRAGVIRDVSHGGAEAPFDATSQWVGRPWVETVTPESRTKIDTLMKEALATGMSKRRQVNTVLADGVDVPIAYTALQIGRDGNMVAVGRDMRHVSALQQRLVESQQAMERDYWRLRHVETRYRLLFQIASDAILVIDAATLKVLDANTAAGLVFGAAPDQLIGRAFPFGTEAADAQKLDELMTTARSAGRAGDILVGLASDGRSYHVSASCFRQESSTLLLVRLSAADMAPAIVAAPDSPLRVLDLLERSPDGFVVTDLDGAVLTANRAFLDIAGLASVEQLRGTLLGTYIGRPGADFPVFTSMLKKHGVVRLMATTARGTSGHQSEVEVSAVWAPDSEEPCIGFSIRDIGRRLAASPQGARDLTRAVEELTTLVGRVALRDLVRDTVDLVERHFIEAALELTNDNRTSAAEVLGVSRQSLYVKLRRHRFVTAGSGDDPPVS
jgi:transcriptional regulator PpsR